MSEEVEFEQIGEFIAHGDYESAIRLSGELLADSDNALREAYQRRDVGNDEVETFVHSALLHIHSLRIVKTQSADAFLCAIGVLLSLEVYNLTQKANDYDKMRLYHYAVQSAIDSFESMLPTETPETEGHRGYILSYLASLLYFYYSRAVTKDNNMPALSEVYQFLQAIKDSGAIQSPTIQFGEKALNPETEAGPLLIDILSRAAALGLS